jgi:hypothetical protein
MMQRDAEATRGQRNALVPQAAHDVDPHDYERA